MSSPIFWLVFTGHTKNNYNAIIKIAPVMYIIMGFPYRSIKPQKWTDEFPKCETRA
jgi:hypothetical protein